MTTEIRDQVVSSDSLEVKPAAHYNNSVTFIVKEGNTTTKTIVSKTDLIDALSKELGWIVIDPAQHPLQAEIDEDYSPSHFLVGGQCFSKTYNPDRTFYEAIRWAVAAQYLRNQPTVDPADVDALTDEIMKPISARTISNAQARIIAESILKSGKVEIKR